MRLFPVIALLLILAAPFSAADGMMGDGMMGGERHREMMQRMMGDMLPPPTDPADLPEPQSEGARLLQRFCTQCHYLYGPGLHTAEQWPAVVERMNRRMQMMGGRSMMMGRIEAPSQEQIAAITDYLQEHAQKPLPEAQTDELRQTEGGDLFIEVCSRCHPLPDPAQHHGSDWPAVVERMRGYMVESGQDLPTEAEWQRIVDFLRTASGGTGDGKGADR